MARESTLLDLASEGFYVRTIPAVQEMNLVEATLFDQLLRAFNEKVDTLVVSCSSGGDDYFSVARNVEDPVCIVKVTVLEIDRHDSILGNPAFYGGNTAHRASARRARTVCRAAAAGWGR